jgi:hypothetical protein
LKHESNGHDASAKAVSDIYHGRITPFPVEEDDEPGPEDLGHKTKRDDLAALEKIIQEWIEYGKPEHKLMIVELGSWVGKSARAIVGAIPNGYDYEVHCIDAFKIAENSEHRWVTKPMWEAVHARMNSGDHDPIFNQFKANVGENLLRNRVFPHRNSTADAARQWINQEYAIDILFMDADHSYEAVHEDLMNWYQKVRDGGLICGDDYRTMPDVRRAVDEFFEEKGLAVGNICSMWFVVKEDGRQNSREGQAASSGGETP